MTALILCLVALNFVTAWASHEAARHHTHAQWCAFMAQGWAELEVAARNDDVTAAAVEQAFGFARSPGNGGR